MLSPLSDKAARPCRGSRNRLDIHQPQQIDRRGDALTYSLRILLYVDAGYFGRAAIEGQKRAENTNDCCLAGAVGPEQAKNGAFRHNEVEVVQSFEVSVVLVQARRPLSRLSYLQASCEGTKYGDVAVPVPGVDVRSRQIPIS